MAQATLKAEKRNAFGRKVKTLRRQGILPANIYGKKIKSLAIQIPAQDFDKVFKTTGETNIIELKVDKEAKTRPVLATNFQKDPISDAPLHIDFHQVDLMDKVTVAVPIEIEGEAPAVKEKGAVLIRLLDEIEVEALPKDLPDKIVVDVSGLNEFDDSVLVKNLKVAEKVVINHEADETVVMVQEPKKEEEAAPAVEAAPEAEALEEEAPAEETEEKGKEKQKPVED